MKTKLSFLSLLLVLALVVGSHPIPIQASGQPRLPAGFDGNGYADLIVGAPRENASGMVDAGAINVFYGWANSGLGATHSQYLTQDDTDMEDTCEDSDEFGRALASGDFNSDGYPDTAIGIPSEDIGTALTAGAVQVLYGGAAGVSAVGDQFWHQDVGNMDGAAETGDMFGYSLAVGDFDGDGYDDLAVGVPYEDIGSPVITNTGAVHVIYGSASGLTATGDQFWSQDTADVEGVAEENDFFGIALAAGDFDHDGRDDLAVGAPYEDHTAIDDSGSVNILYGTSSGLSATGDQIWDQETDAIQDQCEVGDWFGNALASGDYDGDGYDDLAVGIPGEATLTLELRAGAVAILFGSSAGLAASGNQFFDQDDIGESAEAEDNFGAALAAGNFAGSGFDALAIGAPYEDIDGLANAGMVNVVYGSVNGLSMSSPDTWTQGSSGIEGVAEADDLFGFALAAADFDGNGYADLAIGVPYESVDTTSGEQEDAGAVNVIYGGSNGLDDPGDQIWTQSSENVMGVAEAGDRFGWALAAAPIRPQAHTTNDEYIDLAIGIPGRIVGPTSNAGAVNVVFGWSEGVTADGSRYLSQFIVSGDSPDTNDEFGRTLAAGDFDGDGNVDLVIGVPGESVGGDSEAGAVHVLYRAQNGYGSPDDQFWNQGQLSGQTAEADENFGAALAAGDFNGDGYDDLAVGVPGQDLGTLSNAGVVNVLYGSASGLTSTGYLVLIQGLGLQDTAEENDYLGQTLTTGDFNGDGYTDLAVGVPQEDIGTNVNAGAVNVIYGSASGLSNAGNQFWRQGNGIQGAAEANDYFGFALAAGDFDGNGCDDLAIGAPLESYAATSDGVIHVLWGLQAGLSDEFDQLWHQGLLPPETGEDGDQFGHTLAAGNFNGDDNVDLAISATGENTGNGKVHILFGAGTLFTGEGDQAFQDIISENYAYYGYALAAGDFDANGCDDLAIGKPYGDYGASLDAGFVLVYYGASAGLSSANRRLNFNNTSSFVPAADDHFGFALVALDTPRAKGHQIYLPLVLRNF